MTFVSDMLDSVANTKSIKTTKCAAYSLVALRYGCIKMMKLTFSTWGEMDKEDIATSKHSWHV